MLRPRSLLALAAAAVVVATALVVPSGNDRAEAAIGGVTWEDTFDRPAGTPVDGSKWNFDIGGGGWGNGELQYYTNSTSNAVHDGQGNLVITARRDNPANYQCHYGTCQYTSARLLTNGKFTQRYGRFETRMKLPRGQGIWPAFWMLGDNFGSVGWPNSGEIDIMENIGREPNTVYGTVHGPGYSGGGGITAGRTNGQPLADAFHTYSVEWEPNVIRWYFDGQQYHTVTPATLGGRQWVFDHPFFMIMNVAVGGAWPGNPDGSTQFPQTLTVDYVRVNSSDGGGGNPPPPPPPPPQPGGGAIRNAGGRCLDINGALANDGVQLQIWDCNGSVAQQWQLAGDGTVRGMGKCMDPAWGSNADGTPIQLVACNGNPVQRFVISGAGDLVNISANKCVDVSGAINTNGQKLILWPCNGQWNQKWSRP